MTVQDVTRQIDDRITELRDELQRLEQARALLAGNGTTRTSARGGRRRSAAASSGSSTGKRRRGRPRGSGTRALQALDLVRKQPGITIPELADKMGIKQNYLYRVMPTLAGEGKVRKQDKGWFPAEAA